MPSARTPKPAVRMSAAAFQAQVIGQLPQFSEPLKLPAGKAQPKTKALRAQIRLPKPKRITGVEQAWMDQCKHEWRSVAALRIEHEPFTLHLPSGTKYTPDVVVWDGGSIVAIYEVKDEFIHDRRGSLEKFKAARHAFSHLRFIFVQRRAGAWCEEK